MPRTHAFIGEAHQRGSKFPRTARATTSGNEIAADQINLISQPQHHGITRVCLLQLFVSSINANHGAGTSATDGDGIAHGNRTGGDPASVSAVISLRLTDDVLDGETEIQTGSDIAFRRLNGIEQFHDRLAVVPRGVRRSFHHIVTGQCGDRHHTSMTWRQRTKLC